MFNLASFDNRATRDLVELPSKTMEGPALAEADHNAFEFTEDTILELTGEPHLGDIDSLLLRGRGVRSLEGLKALNLPNLQVTH